MVKVPSVTPSVGLVPGVMVILGVVFNSTETSLLPLLTAAKSSLPSPLKSPTVTELGLLPTEKSVAVPKPPVPLPSSTETVLPLATAKSSLPSPLKSPTVTELIPLPTEKSVAVPKPPVPLPSSTETVLPLATAKSSLPSLLKSPTVTDLG